MQITQIMKCYKIEDPAGLTVALLEPDGLKPPTA